MVDLVLYCPEIPQNTGALLRLGACWNVAVHIIHPLGFVWDDKGRKRACMDYTCQTYHYDCWDDLCRTWPDRKKILLEGHGHGLYHHDYAFQTQDMIVLGQESCGFPQNMKNLGYDQVRIPQSQGTRSLNMALAATTVLSEALRQTQGWPV